MEIQTLSQAGFDFIAHNEGNILHPYLDSAGIPTIGVGMTYYPDTGKRVSIKDPAITAARSQALFLMMVAPRCKTVYSLTRDTINQNQFNSLVDFEYNTGHLKGSTLLERVNHGGDIAEAFLMWDKIHMDGKLIVDEDLKERRLRNIALYNKV